MGKIDKYLSPRLCEHLGNMPEIMEDVRYPDDNPVYTTTEKTVKLLDIHGAEKVIENLLKKYT